MTDGIDRTLYEDVHDERIRAHGIWSPTGSSMEVLPHDSPRRLPILVEEVGEVAKALNENSPVGELRMELVQVAAMATAWIAALDRGLVEPPSGHMHSCEHGADRTLCYCDTPDVCTHPGRI